jgi:hemin uptake protein HemP
MTDQLPPSNPQTADATPAQPAERRSIESAELFQGGRMVEIVHAGETYRLLLTRNNRLILQK